MVRHANSGKSKLPITEHWSSVGNLPLRMLRIMHRQGLWGANCCSFQNLCYSSYLG